MQLCDRAIKQLHKINNVATVALGEAQLLDRFLENGSTLRPRVDAILKNLHELRLLLMEMKNPGD